MKDNVKIAPSCLACKAHEDLEGKMSEMVDKNTHEHGALNTNMDKLAGDVHWMNLIGKWVLGTMLGYYIMIGYYILNQDSVAHYELKEITKSVRNVEIQNLHNKNNIENIRMNLESIKTQVTAMPPRD